MDYCRYYALCTKFFHELGDLDIQPCGNVEVVATWNGACSAAVGRIAAALATGNTCTLKADAKAAPVACLVAQAFYAAGFTEQALKLDVDHPAEIQYPEGSKNAIILTAKGDRGHAIMNACHSAFTGAGQKAAACSLLLVERSVYENADFFEKLKDCASSLMCGPVTNTGNIVGPMITNHNPRLERALQLDEGERWLVAPEFVDEEHFILRPTVKVGVRPGSYTFRTPLFAPLLAVAPFDTLAEAVSLVNSLGYSLASGLQSLDEEEQRYWKSHVRAGNLYINRGITGAVVGRQPFGSLRTGAACSLKTGGPNHVTQFMTIADKADSKTDYRTSYSTWYEREFRHARNLHPEIRGEQNIFRYLPLKGGMALRLCGGETKEQVQKVVLAAATVGTSLTISMDENHALSQQLKEFGGAVCKREPLSAFCASLSNFDRIRTLSANVPQELLDAADRAGIFVERALPVSDGRVELLRYLAEQSISNEYHRYGSQIEVPNLE